MSTVDADVEPLIPEINESHKLLRLADRRNLVPVDRRRERNFSRHYMRIDLPPVHDVVGKPGRLSVSK